MLLTGNPPQGKRHTYLRVKGWKTIFQTNGPKKQAGVAILILNKIDFQPKVIKKDKEGHLMLIKGKILQEEISIINIYGPNARASTFITETLVKLKANTAPHTIISGSLQHNTLINGEILETETKQGHSETNRCYKTNGFNRYL